MLILLSTLTVLKKNIPDKECFYSSAKDGTGDNGKKLDGHMSDEDYWAWKTWKVNWLTHV